MPPVPQSSSPSRNEHHFPVVPCEIQVVLLWLEQNQDQPRLFQSSVADWDINVPKGAGESRAQRTILMGQQSLKPPGLAGERVPTSQSKTGRKRKLLTLANFGQDGKGYVHSPSRTSFPWKTGVTTASTTHSINSHTRWPGGGDPAKHHFIPSPSVLGSALASP